MILRSGADCPFIVRYLVAHPLQNHILLASLIGAYTRRPLVDACAAPQASQPQGGHTDTIPSKFETVPASDFTVKLGTSGVRSPKAGVSSGTMSQSRLARALLPGKAGETKV